MLQRKYQNKTIARQERPQTVGLGVTQRVHNVNAADLGAADLELYCLPKIIMGGMAAILLTELSAERCANTWSTNEFTINL